MQHSTSLTRDHFGFGSDRIENQIFFFEFCQVEILDQVRFILLNRVYFISQVETRQLHISISFFFLEEILIQICPILQRFLRINRL